RCAQRRLSAARALRESQVVSPPCDRRSTPTRRAFPPFRVDMGSVPVGLGSRISGCSALFRAWVRPGASQGTPGGSFCAENRLGAFGSLPVCGGGCPVARGLLLLQLCIIAPGRGQSLVRGGQDVVG